MSPTLNLLECEALLEPDQHYPLYITAKKYWLPEFEAHWDDEDAVTLILLHATSFHKETWQPTLERLFQCALAHSRNPSKLLKIKCAWAIDCPNHGVSAALNDDALRQPPFYRNCESFWFNLHDNRRTVDLAQSGAANMQMLSIDLCLLDQGSNPCLTSEASVLSE
jgi:hypothetical protein